MDFVVYSELRKLMQSACSWNFDIFRVDHLSGGNALCHVGHYLLRDVPCQALNIESKLLVNFLLEIQRGYTATNP
ncbi:hypothetical protein CCR75_000438 [Bremia lactucae]|uniref:Uncharacterized protein n=1 Tax=Bremia lactucae TaxID=4779 RepID=A0A976FI98_BRELC|nr:hypothetical protein CCR75_000438 [Bremia lactucae]